MPIPNTYQVDLSGIAKDFAALAQTRLLTQFKGKPVLTALIGAFAAEVQELYDAILGVIRLRCLYYAFGQQLDALGRIVGQRRELEANDIPVYFGMDADDTASYPSDSVTMPYGIEPDIGVAWAPGAPVTGTYPATDGQYAMQIMGRIQANMTRFASWPEIQASIKAVFAVTSKYELVEGSPMTINVIVPAGTSADTIYRIGEWANTARTDQRFFMGWPATLAINEVITA